MREPKQSGSAGSGPSHENGPTRRKLMRNMGAGTLVGFGLVQAMSTGAAEEHSAIRTEPLSQRATGNLRGSVMSSSAFKTVRQQLRDTGYVPDLGSSVQAKRVVNEETGEEWPVMEIECKVRVDGSPATDKRPSLFVREKDGRIEVRCVAHPEPDLVDIYDCTCPADDFSGADETNLGHYRIPLAEGGE